MPPENPPPSPRTPSPFRLGFRIFLVMLARFKHPPCSPDHDESRRSVLVTGASGRIGTRFAEETHQRYRLSLLTHPEESGEFSDLEKFGSVLQGRLQDIETLKRACAKICKG